MSGAQAWLTSRSKEWKTNISPRNIFDFMVQRMERCSSLGTTQITHPHARTHAHNKYLIVILRKDFSKPYCIGSSLIMIVTQSSYYYSIGLKLG